MQPHNHPSRPHRHKILLHNNVSNKFDLNIGQELADKAINRSYLKQMVGGDTLRAEEVVNTVLNYALTLIP